MSANVGDRIRMYSNSVDVPARTGTIVAVLGSRHGPPYRVRVDSGEETIVTPGPDAVIEPPTWSDKIDQVSDQVAERTERWRGTAREKAEEVRGTARQAGEQARTGAQHAAGSAARRVAAAAERIAKRLEK